VNNGYEQGFRAGQADQQDRWKANYQNSYAYQDANYGYSGYYVNQADYNYYFRQGFRRGYEDGYNSRTQYGSQSNGSYSILGTILAQILNLQSLR
jgi:flagellar biosynthesis/type III secretory pathway protein FliH